MVIKSEKIYLYCVAFVAFLAKESYISINGVMTHRANL